MQLTPVSRIPTQDELHNQYASMTLDDYVEKERSLGLRFGPYERHWYRLRAPERIREYLRLAQVKPYLVGATPTVAVTPANLPTFSMTSIATTVTETFLWIPGQFSNQPWTDPPFPGKVYEVNYGGIYSTTATPTVVNTLRWSGATTTTVGGVVIGLSVALTTTTGAANLPFMGSAFVVFRTVGLGATSATVVANGATNFASAAGAAPGSVLVFGTNSTATVDTLTQSNVGIGLGWTWGTSSASNTVTCQWMFPTTIN